MKQFLTIALLCGSSVLAAQAQNIVITAKDGIPQKFNADYIEEITFEKIGDASKAPDFNHAIDSSLLRKMMKADSDIPGQDNLMYYSLLVNNNDNTSVEYAFEYFPVATFDGADMVISDDFNAESMRHSIDGIKNLTIKKIMTGITDVAADSHMKVYFGKDEITISGLRHGDKVTICDLSGSVVASSTADSSGLLSIPTGNLGKGVFVASTPGHSFKFIR